MSAQNARKRAWNYGSSTIISTVIFLAILSFIALIGERHPWRLDLTESGTFSLSEQTRNILKNIDQPVSIKAFCATASPEQVKAKDLLDTYRYVKKNISFEFIDPDRQPDLAKRYEIRTYGTLVLEGYGKKQTIQNIDEESITNAIFRLTRNQQKKIYFLVGHGEHSFKDTGKDGYGNIGSALEKENYTVAELNLLQAPKVPDDAAVLIIAGPQKQLLTQEIDTLKGYLSVKGKLMVLVDPYKDGGLRNFLKSYGVVLSDDVIIDKLSRVFGGNYLMPVVTAYGHHRITESFDVATFYPEARSVQAAKEPPKGVRVEVLASTSDNAWAERNLDLVKQGQASFEEKDDLPGPVPLVVLSEIDIAQGKAPASRAEKDKEKGQGGEEKKDKAPPKAYLLVSGDSDFAGNANFGLSGNGDFFLNIVNFLAEEEQLITVDHPDKGNKPLLLSQNQARMMLWLVLVFVPLLVVLSGLAVYRVRRAQR